MADLTGWTMMEVRRHTYRDLVAFVEYKQRQARERRLAARRRRR